MHLCLRSNPRESARGLEPRAGFQLQPRSFGRGFGSPPAAWPECPVPKLWAESPGTTAGTHEFHQTTGGVQVAKCPCQARSCLNSQQEGGQGPALTARGLDTGPTAPHWSWAAATFRAHGEGCSQESHLPLRPSVWSGLGAQHRATGPGSPASPAAAACLCPRACSRPARDPEAPEVGGHLDSRRP